MHQRTKIVHFFFTKSAHVLVNGRLNIAAIKLLKQVKLAALFIHRLLKVMSCCDLIVYSIYMQYTVMHLAGKWAEVMVWGCGWMGRRRFY